MTEPKGDDIEEAEVDAVLAEFNGNARAAIKALLHDLEVLARDSVSVSRGFVRHEKVIVLRERRREPG